MPSHIPEPMLHRDPVKVVRSLALRKAQAVARSAKTGIILGADTVVVLGNKILGKPKDAQDAYKMLYRLSGSLHRVVTGVALVNAETGRHVVDHETSQVRMRKMSIEELLRLSRKHLDKAGAYAIQEKKDPIATVVRGSYDNVVGLPVGLVRSLLKKLSRDV